MAIIVLRDLSDDLYRRLKRAAEIERRSVPAEIICLIERVLPMVELSSKRVEILDSLNAEWVTEAQLPTDSIELLREDRSR